MKKTLFLLCALLSSNAFARGVVVKCWDVGAEQTDKNLIYQFDGGYIHSNVLKVNGKSLEFSQVSEACIDWEFPSVCDDTVKAGAQTFEMKLASVGAENKDGLEPMIGYIKGQSKKAIALSCTREAL